MPRSNRRVRSLSRRAFSMNEVEHLEARRLFSGYGKLEAIPGQVVEERPDLVGAPGLRVLDPADIVWVNRAVSDNFDLRFGTSAAQARAVVDAVIVAYERMIGSFDYALAGQTYSLTLSMSGSGSGFGASAGLNSSLGGKPKSGVINMGAGNGSANANDFNGWFMDPTPFESSEFQGTIQNAFAGDAQAGSPAFNVGDFYTVVAAEMTHCMGLFGASLTLWSSKTTNTGQADSTAGPGFYWVFQGPSVKHLMTSDNGGSQDFGAAIHSAEPNINVNFGGFTYAATNDQGNALYEFSRRYMINQAFALMFKDAYGYATQDPAQFSTGTMYSNRNQTTNNILVRAGGGANAISVTRAGNTVTVSVDPTTDVAGTGALPGAGNLPAWVTNYDISEVSSITIIGSVNADTFTIGTNIGVPISIDGGASADSLTYVGTSSGETINLTSTTMTSGTTSVTLSGTTVENVSVDGSGGTDTINVTETTAAVPITVINSTGDDTVNVNVDNLGSAQARFASTMNLGSLNVGAGGLANMLANGSRVLVVNGGTLSVTVGGAIDLNDNDMIREYTGASQIGAVQTLLNLGRAAGVWPVAGITSTAAKNNAAHNTSVGAIEASDYKSVFGAGATFDGQTIDTTAVLVKYTYYGDTDFNGVVNFDDYSRTDAGFNFGRTGWFNGDFDGNGVVNFDDYSLVDLAFNTQGPALIGLKPGLGKGPALRSL